MKVPVFVAELAPKELRGLLTAINQVIPYSATNKVYIDKYFTCR